MVITERITQVVRDRLRAGHDHESEPCGVLPPLVKWGRPEYGPYTLPADATAALGASARVVSLPPGNARRGLCVWPRSTRRPGTTSSPPIRGLRAELADVVRSALREAGHVGLAGYWADPIDETPPTPWGIPHMGAAAGVGLLATFRGFNLAWGDGARLRSEGASDDEHPADVVRGFLAAATIRTLPFEGAAAWAAALDHEDAPSTRRWSGWSARGDVGRGARLGGGGGPGGGRDPGPEPGSPALGEIPDLGAAPRRGGGEVVGAALAGRGQVTRSARTTPRTRWRRR